jgi:hypothetical protein
MTTLSRRVWVALSVALMVLAATPLLASAHERRAVGNYSFLVGFNDEPAIQGQPNGAQLTVTDPNNNNQPVEGLASTLKATVAFGGGQPKDFPMASVFGKPGVYVAYFIPTRAGTYIFNFTGTVNGQQVNELFESGPGRFSDVDAVAGLQFPDTIPLSNDVARTAQSAADQAGQAQAAADSARNVGVIGVLVGVLGVILGGIGLLAASNRRSATAGTVQRQPR